MSIRAKIKYIAPSVTSKKCLLQEITDMKDVPAGTPFHIYQEQKKNDFKGRRDDEGFVFQNGERKTAKIGRQ
ncbi:hypothetical protein SERLA73DRAFT_121526 [Serpula lacrymans var. lacrymans S7.3]|uniref:Uncharacterized protein n=2 Tax=Serpula lacrymans var. lacrymans TaxID=341189 RepID=F8PRV4_SERL3|nr:uncharacterized protein SERLADRAFT_368354 [Serpula lacrymans var. lacrymans S7.9]EGO01189.1 hypothetical protein SERLA73DRAFT_121526 [Serpula lacrymans var. lacrymans S7.3]EGO26837.1 hypothetical protein SERLADRAFT_368354 [Serpula lacrymans var. lacrymans S7.9]